MTTPALAETVKGRGRHYRHPETDELVPSVTNILSMLNKPALVGWAAKVVAEQAAELRKSLGEMEHDEVVSLLKGAASRQSRSAADRGTDIHGLLEAVARNGELPELSAKAEQYREAAMRFWNDKVEGVFCSEVTMFAPDYAGTADAVLFIDGAVCLVDYKTSSGVYAETALQLSALDAATIWANTHIQPMECEKLMVVRLGTNGKYETRVVIDREQHQQAFRSLLNVWKWKHDIQPYL